MEDALRGFAVRAAGCAVLLLALWFIFALVFHDPFLTGFMARGNFGVQSLVGNLVGFLRYGIGWIPTLFLFLCLGRWGLSMLLRRMPTHAPEYNILRGFIAVAAGSVAMGALFPQLTFGGIAGWVAAADISKLAGDFTWAVGIVLTVGFLLMAGAILNITLTDIRAVISVVRRGVRWILSAFHLLPPMSEDDAEEEEGEEEEEEEVEQNAKSREQRAKRKSAISNQQSAIKSKIINHKSEIFELPPPAFLEKSALVKNVITPELKRNAAAMEAHFEEFGVYGKVMGIKPGPVVTLYEFEPDSGQRMAKIADTVKDMTRAMATENIRIAHIPRTNYVGVEMVNMNRATLRFQGLITNPAFTESKYKIPLALGVDIGGNPMYFDLAKMPHVLIAGRTGSGKSVFVQSIILSVLYHFTPDKCKLIMVDPKGVDFTLWDNIPHLVTPVLTDPASSVNALKWSVREMEERYKKLKELGVQ
ncbi:MAG: DUF87 domain-containing protein, partial [Rickettsiales bacterium]|nr:DUF87 domain-containing protein [Rickettsiales bacterium]